MFYLGEAPERGVLRITFEFEDSLHAAVTPDSATWTLTDRAGTVINARADVTITPLGNTVIIILSDADLALGVGIDEYRLFTVDYVYTSSDGNGMPMHGVAMFKVVDAKMVT